MFHDNVCLRQVKLMTDSLRSSEFSSYAKVPDPYFGGAKGFDLVSAAGPVRFLPQLSGGVCVHKGALFCMQMLCYVSQLL